MCSAYTITYVHMSFYSLFFDFSFHRYKYRNSRLSESVFPTPLLPFAHTVYHYYVIIVIEDAMGICFMRISMMRNLSFEKKKAVKTSVTYPVLNYLRQLFSRLSTFRTSVFIIYRTSKILCSTS